MKTADSFQGQFVLALAHVAGMIDMVALPLWIGALIQYYKYSPVQAGITVTLFLFGVVVSSVMLAPKFNHLPRRFATALGFGLASLIFAVMCFVPVSVKSFQLLAVLHIIAGIGVGTALTFTHGVMGRCSNPHRSWAIANVVLGVFAVVFFAGIPQLILRIGPSGFFAVVSITMGLAAIVVALLFPAVAPSKREELGIAAIVGVAIPKAAWFVIAVIVCLTLNQSMVFAFVERIGTDGGYGQDKVNAVLIALGLVNLTPGILAALLEKKWSPIAVGFAGPIGQALLAVLISSGFAFGIFAVAAAFYVFMVIFTHTFLFGLLSKLDSSGRAAAATPAMMMIGSCIGPALGGVIVQSIGYKGLGWAACFVAIVAAICMTQCRSATSNKYKAQAVPVQGS